MEVVGHRGAGVGRDRAVAALSRPLDQGLGARGEVLPGGLRDLHRSRADRSRADADGVGRLFQHEKQKSVTNWDDKLKKKKKKKEAACLSRPPTAMIYCAGIGVKYGPARILRQA